MSRKSVSEKIVLCFCIIIFLTGIGCSSGSSGDDSNGNSTSNNKITQEEANQLMNSLTGAVNASGATSSSSANVKAEINENISDGKTENSANDLKASVTLATTCSTSNYQAQAALNDSTACSSAGHITWTGNIKTYCTSWMYYPPTQYNNEYCVCNGEWRSQTMVVFQYGDRTNNLYDCDMGGLIVDGTVTLTMSGPAEDPDMQFAGTLSLNRRGSTGGLHPLESCNINYGYWASSKQWHGSICGYPVH
jgi:hypothetical protein